MVWIQSLVLKEPLLFKTPFEAASKTIYIDIYFVCILYTSFASIFEAIVVQYYQFIHMISTSSIMKFHLLKLVIFHFGSKPKWMHASRVPLWCSFLKGNNTLSVAMVLILGYSNILKWQPMWLFTFGYLLTSPYMCPFCDFMTHSL